VKDVDCKVVVGEEVLDTWKAYYDKLSYEQFVYDKHSLWVE